MKMENENENERTMKFVRHTLQNMPKKKKMRDKLKAHKLCYFVTQRGGAENGEGEMKRGQPAAAEGNLTLDCIEQALDIWGQDILID